MSEPLRGTQSSNKLRVAENELCKSHENGYRFSLFFFWFYLSTQVWFWSKDFKQLVLVWCLRDRVKSLFIPSIRSRSYEQEELLTENYQIERRIACGHYGRIFSGKIKEEIACFKQINDKATFERERHIMAKLRTGSKFRLNPV